jgi:hypothetical protein
MPTWDGGMGINLGPRTTAESSAQGSGKITSLHAPAGGYGFGLSVSGG